MRRWKKHEERAADEETSEPVVERRRRWPRLRDSLVVLGSVSCVVWQFAVTNESGAKWRGGRRGAAGREHCIVPKSTKRRFYAYPANAKFGAALIKRGWRQVRDAKNAQIVWHQKKGEIPWDRLRCWQRPNHLRGEWEIGNKKKLIETLRRGDASAYLPESYVLERATDRAQFVKAVWSEPQGSTPSWVIKVPHLDGGKGVEVLFADQARAMVAAGLEEHESKVAQRYVTDLLLIDGRKFDLRVYWAVASLKPPLVLYHDGTLRVSLERFDSANHTKSQHLTNAAQQAGGHDAAKSSELSRRPMSALWDLLATVADDPEAARARIECSIRTALASIWTAHAAFFRNKLEKGQREADAFVLFGADFMVDQSFRVYLSEVQSGPGLPTNTKAVRKLMSTMIPHLADIVTFLHGTQTKAEDRHRSALPRTNFELLVNDSTVLESHWCRT